MFLFRSSPRNALTSYTGVPARLGHRRLQANSNRIVTKLFDCHVTCECSSRPDLYTILVLSEATKVIYNTRKIQHLNSKLFFSRGCPVWRSGLVRGCQIVDGKGIGLQWFFVELVNGECNIQDYDLSAIYMRNWDTADESGTDKTGCAWKQEWEDVQKLCRFLDLPVELVPSHR
jgi:hypothetical protein